VRADPPRSWGLSPRTGGEGTSHPRHTGSKWMSHQRAGPYEAHPRDLGQVLVAFLFERDEPLRVFESFGDAVIWSLLVEIALQADCLPERDVAQVVMILDFVCGLVIVASRAGAVGTPTLEIARSARATSRPGEREASRSWRATVSRVRRSRRRCGPLDPSRRSLATAWGPAARRRARRPALRVVAASRCRR
jgi:hypothetical protein